MRGDLYNGEILIAGQFPPSLNTSDEPSVLKLYESPECYGIDCTVDGRLKSGAIPTGTARVVTTKTISATTYYWHFDRVWRSSTADLIYGAKFYDDVYHIQGRGKVTAEANIVTFMPCFRNTMWLATTSGSQFIAGADSDAGQFTLSSLFQELSLSTGKGTSALTLDGIPYVANTNGVFSYDGTSIKELTRTVRNNLGCFDDEPAITADYKKKLIIGTSKFVIDTVNGKLFDYSSSGFRFTTRTITSQNYRPFGLGSIYFSVEFSNDTTDATISWQTKSEEEDWFDEDDINVAYDENSKTLIEVRMENPINVAHKFAIRITGISANLSIRQISMNVADFAHGTFSA